MQLQENFAMTRRWRSVEIALDRPSIAEHYQHVAFEAFMTTKLAINDLREIARLAREIGGTETGIAAQLVIDLLISTQFSDTALSPEIFKVLFERRLERHRAMQFPASCALH
jgi:hypothetical protein